MENLKSSYVPSAAAKAGSGHIAKRKEEATVPTSLRMPSSLHARARVYSVTHGVPFRRMLIEGLEQWLDEHEPAERK